MEFRKCPRDFHKFDIRGCYDTGSPSNILKHTRQHRMKLQGHPHILTCHGKIPDTYKCPNCDFETNLKVSLIYHLNLNHKNLQNKAQFRNVLRQCGYCDFQTYSILVLLTHSSQCDKWEADENKIINWLECGQCLFKTKFKRYLRKHVKEMHSTNITWHYCDICEFKSKRKYQLKQHIVNIHTDLAKIAWYHCDNCKFKSKTKSSLKQHIISVHTKSANVVWYNCDRCEYKAKRKANLKEHIANIHPDSINIVWHHCGKCEFISYKQGHLKRHIALFHKDSRDLAWYYCKKCTYITKSKPDLEGHIANVHAN